MLSAEEAHRSRVSELGVDGDRFHFVFPPWMDAEESMSCPTGCADRQCDLSIEVDGKATQDRVRAEGAAMFICAWMRMRSIHPTTWRLV